MSTQSEATRYKKPGFKDPKLVIGLLLILVSVVGVVGIVRFANKSEPFYMASSDIKIGDALTSANLKVVDVQLGESAGHYVRADVELTEGTVAMQPIKSGELIASSEITDELKDGRRLTTLLMDHYAVAGFSSGDLVDVWVSFKREGSNDYEAPQSLVSHAEIHSITAQESIIGGTGKTAVELWVNADQLSQVLSASNGGAAINLIPAAYGEG
ncbi:SAF domain-containing protein [Rothia nasimurium]|uniref:SAF domain-containing protein n=1 Tax=Rothia nasimurium TaxID=85336 RepID=UPI003B9E4BDA